MRTTRQQLLALLGDGAVHSGEVLGAQLGISRAAVWKQIAALGELGLGIERVPGRGYRLGRPLDLLGRERILEELNAAARRSVVELQVLDTVDSTNAVLLREVDLLQDGAVACVAERQTAGRGRRGRHWFSPYGANLYLSLSWPFERLPPDFPALGLAAGVGARRALRALGFGQVQLKWPNDLYANRAKLGGILLEMRGEPPGRCRIVAGIGVNVQMPPTGHDRVDQAWIDLAALAGGALPSRNQIAARLLECWVEAFGHFAKHGFGDFIDDWRSADVLAGRQVTVIDGDRRWQGLARGVTADGSLEVETPAGVQRFIAGEVSLREEA